MFNFGYIAEIFTKNLGYKLLALLITILLWLLVMGRDDVVVQRDLDIIVHLPDNYNVVRMEPSRVSVSVKGNPKLIRRYFEKKTALVFDIYNTSNNNLRLEIYDSKLELPFGVRVESIEPKYFEIKMETKDK